MKFLLLSNEGECFLSSHNVRAMRTKNEKWNNEVVGENANETNRKKKESNDPRREIANETNHEDSKTEKPMPKSNGLFLLLLARPKTSAVGNNNEPTAKKRPLQDEKVGVRELGLGSISSRDLVARQRNNSNSICRFGRMNRSNHK